MSALQEFILFWREFYSKRLDPSEVVEELLGDLRNYSIKSAKFDTVYDSVMDAIGDQVSYYPEPYFGFFGEGNVDTSPDVLALFMNPGEIKDATSSWNEETIKQYTERSSEYFLQECGVKDQGQVGGKVFPPCTCYLKEKGEKGCNDWRRKRYKEIREDLGLKDLRFLHSMEIFPFHSKNYDNRIKGHLKKIAKLPFMQLALHAIKEIASQNKVKAIMAVGADWEKIFDEMIWHYSEKKSFSGEIGRIAYYQAAPESSPIMVFIRKNPKVSFKGSAESIRYMKEILSIDEITEDLRRTNEGDNIKEEERVNNDDISQSIMKEMVSRIHERIFWRLAPTTLIL